ncbi:DNA-binding protein [Microlunatus ginsengisoli]|uniref:Ribbon-helix-helix protein, CopG family n=1 Tax=Microlunatus ginsengisoli TaxID=363863 RepID=A0ABP7AG66_9ACTN
MAMTLRLSKEQTEALRRKAEEEGRSMQEVALTAVDQYVRARPERIRTIVADIMATDAELLDRLSR